MSEKNEGPSQTQLSTMGEVRLAREMTLFDATMIGVGALLGGGIFALIGIAAGLSGPGLLLAFVLNTFLTIPTLLIYAELGSAYHDAGGGYLWIHDALHQPWGFVAGWIGWFSHAVACGVYALASAHFTVWLLDFYALMPPGLDHGLATKALAFSLTATFVGLNMVGVKNSTRTENVMTAVTIAILCAFIGWGLLAINSNPLLAGRNFADFMPHGFGGVFVAMGITFIAFEGYEIIAQSSEEVKNPKENIPRALGMSLLIVAPIYLLVVFVALGAVDGGSLGASWVFLADSGVVAIVESAGQFMPFGATVALAAALLSNITALNATIYSSSRVAYAMSRHHDLPDAFSEIHPRWKTPHLGILASGAIIAAMALVLPIEAVAAAANLMFLILFALVNISYIKLRNTTENLDYGFRAPFFPITPLIGLFAQVFLAIYLFSFSPLAWLAGAGWIALGFAAYYVGLRPREEAEHRLAVERSVAHREVPAIRKNFRVLVPVANPETAAGIARVASSIAKSLDGEVDLLYVVEVPDVTPLTEGHRFVSKALPVLENAKTAMGKTSVPVHTLVRIGHNTSQVIRETAMEEGASLILLGWSGRGRITDFLKARTIEGLVEVPPCDIAVLKLREGKELSKVLIPTHGGRHAPLGIRLGSAIARANVGAVTVYHAMNQDETDFIARRARGEALIEQNAIRGVPTRLKIEQADRVLSRVIDVAKEADLVVVGATTEPSWRNYLFGHKTEEIAERANANVLMVKSHGGPTVHTFREFYRNLRQFGRYLTGRRTQLG
ncbi:MAG: amino acid permease [Euryarchaeota archaeon]|nr:amino acid permease [Euryarchaeota archaeon]